MSGGFFVCRKELFDYIDDREDLVFEEEPMRRLVTAQFRPAVSSKFVFSVAPRDKPSQRKKTWINPIFLNMGLILNC